MDPDKTADTFISSIDPGLLPYKKELFRLAVTSMQTLKFLRPWEVRGMDIPDVYKRMLISKILNLQTPETKLKMKDEIDTRSPKVKQPKKLHFSKKINDRVHDDNPVTETDMAAISGMDPSDGECTPAKKPFIDTEIGKLEDERETFTILLVHKKNELKDMRTPPIEPLAPLPAHRGVLTKTMCDRCHRRGHKAHGNRGGESCPYDICEGFKHCGNLHKHKEYKQAIMEMEKEIGNLEKELHSNEDRIKSLKTFLETNTTNFVRQVRPQLQLKNKYIGKEGLQKLLKDVRFLKIATNGKIPPNLHSMSAEELDDLIAKGKMQVSSKFEVKDVSTEGTTPQLQLPSQAGTPHQWQCTPQQPTTVGSQPIHSMWPAIYPYSPISLNTPVSPYNSAMYDVYGGSPQFSSPYHGYNMWCPRPYGSSSTVSTPPPELEIFPPLPKENPRAPSPLPPLPEGGTSPPSSPVHVHLS
ncbi:uncharacterized protein LOC117345053 [Pecten maximus]|uniref:uncharacterized protein LOC117345053 n=1 Tax=Pecten maximus TaxID=6579 RepID=UPI001458C710|nr:uncharacterized protein LOC117345053 [Pecten maximus]